MAELGQISPVELGQISPVELGQISPVELSIRPVLGLFFSAFALFVFSRLFVSFRLFSSLP